MALLTEFVGAAGAGKTTVARALEFMRLPVREPAVLLRPERLCTQWRWGRRSSGPAALWLRRFVERHRFTRGLLLVPRADGEDLLAAFAEAHPAFTELCLAQRRDERPLPYRLVAQWWMSVTLTTHMMIRSTARDDAVAIVDEGLAQRCLSVIGPEATDDRATEYFDAMPAPDAVVYLAAPVDTLLERLAGRGTTARRHRGLDAAAVRRETEISVARLERGLDVLATRGVPILEVDAGQPLPTSLDQIRGFVARVRAFDGTTGGGSATVRDRSIE